MIYSVKFPENIAYIHAENLTFAISTAKRLGRQVFFTTKVHVREVNNPTPEQILSADQCCLLIGDPVPKRNKPETIDPFANLWADLSKHLSEAGL